MFHLNKLTFNFVDYLNNETHEMNIDKTTVWEVHVPVFLIGGGFTLIMTTFLCGWQQFIHDSKHEEIKIDK